MLFNGNLHFAGAVPKFRFYDVWKARADGETINAPSYVQDFSLDIPDEFAAQSYSTTWTSVTGTAKRGNDTLKVGEDVSDWAVGSQVGPLEVYVVACGNSNLS